MGNAVFLPSCDRRSLRSCLMAMCSISLSCTQTVTVPPWTRALRNGPRRDWGNLLAMLKRAFPKHTASNDLLKKHISTSFPIFHTSSLIYFPSFFPWSDPLSLHCVFHCVLFLQTSPLLSCSSFLSFPPPSGTHTPPHRLLTYPSLTVIVNTIRLSNPYPELKP